MTLMDGLRTNHRIENVILTERCHRTNHLSQLKRGQMLSTRREREYENIIIPKASRRSAIRLTSEQLPVAKAMPLSWRDASRI